MAVLLGLYAQRAEKPRLFRLAAGRCVSIPRGAVPEARRFLKLAGVNTFPLFPDLDGLARYLLADSQP